MNIVQSCEAKKVKTYEKEFTSLKKKQDEIVKNISNYMDYVKKNKASEGRITPSDGYNVECA